MLKLMLLNYSKDAPDSACGLALLDVGASPVPEFTHVTLLASGFEDVSSAQDGLEQIQGYVQDNITPILNACYRLFQCVAADIAAGGAAQDMDRADAVEVALGYLAGAAD